VSHKTCTRSSDWPGRGTIGHVELKNPGQSEDRGQVRSCGTPCKIINTQFIWSNRDVNIAMPLTGAKNRWIGSYLLSCMYSTLLLQRRYIWFVFVLHKGDCSGERLGVCRKKLRILKHISSYTLTETSGVYCCPTIWVASWNFTRL
jgi:hypothetical protein